jgi:hippocalcin-like protein 1
LFALEERIQIIFFTFPFSFSPFLQAIYDMLGACSSNKPADSAEERAKNIFAKMDENNDGQLTQDEFLKGCLQDEELSKMLAP